jgi:hypothetical protein
MSHHSSHSPPLFLSPLPYHPLDFSLSSTEGRHNRSKKEELKMKRHLRLTQRKIHTHLASSTLRRRLVLHPPSTFDFRVPPILP